ncbi:MAG TPA: phosphotransferase, partial [bacterium]|nr:phosphotransferase [bacterium]
TRFISGRCPSATEMRTPEMLGRVVESMRRYHEGPEFNGSFSPFSALEQYLFASRRYGAPLPQDTNAMYRGISKIEEALRRAPPVILPCHNDLWEPNLIDDGAHIRIVDWEYAGMGDVYFDLANFAIHHDFSDLEDEGLLSRRFGTVLDRSLARLKLMKIVAELREAMWCMVGMNVLSSAFDFVGYATAHFERYRQAFDDPRLPGWLLEAPLTA